MSQVAVVIPGIMGSELRLDDEVIWPGPVSSLWLPYTKLPQLMRDDLRATDIIRSVSISEQYQGLLYDLVSCGFREDDTPPTLLVCPYDWRKPNEVAAGVLADLLDRAVAQHGRQVEITLIAHSMGGLVSRYYLESGAFAGRPGLAAVRRLITIGTPHRGSPLALTAALGQEKRLFLSKDQVLTLASDSRFPSLYQLLPPPGEPFAWNEASDAAFRHIDIYEAKEAKALGLVLANLQAAERFHTKLNLDRRPPHVRYFFFVGTRQRTPAAALLLPIDGRYRIQKVEPEDAGDGTVPVWSAGITGTQSRPVGGEHSTLYRNDDLRRTLAVLLGKPGVLAAAPTGVQVWVRERVSEPEEMVHAVFTFGVGTTDIDGELRLQRVQLDVEGNVAKVAAFGSPLPIRYQGLAVEKLGVTFDAPNITGIYRVEYYNAGAREPSGSDELFVQEPSSP